MNSTNNKKGIGRIDGRMGESNVQSTHKGNGKEPTMSTKPVSEKMYNLTSASAYLDVDPHYLRKLVREGKIVHVRENIPGTQIKRIMISQSVLDARKAEVADRPERLPEGHRRYIYRGPVSLVETIIKEHPEAKAYFELANPGKKQS